MGVKKVEFYDITCDSCKRHVRLETPKPAGWVNRYEPTTYLVWDPYMKQDYKEKGHKTYYCCPDCKHKFYSWAELNKH